MVFLLLINLFLESCWCFSFQWLISYSHALKLQFRWGLTSFYSVYLLIFRRSTTQTFFCFWVSETSVMYFGEILLQITRIIMWRFLFSEAAAWFIILAFSNLKMQNRTAGVTIVVAKAGRVKSLSYHIFFCSSQFSSEKKVKGSIMLVLVSWLLFFQEPAQLMSEFRSMKMVWDTLTLRDKRYNHFPCRLAKKQEKLLLFGNTVLYFLIFIQTWEFLVKLKWKHW